MRLLPAALLVSAALVGLSACSTPDPAPVASDTPAPAITATTDGAGLTFAQGLQLSDDVVSAPVFLNGFAAADSGWTRQDGTNADQGYFVYASEDSTCTMKLSQIAAADENFDLVAGDDAASSVNALAWYFRSSDMVDEVTAGATDAIIPYGTDWTVDDPGVDFKGVSATTADGSAFATYARVFSVPKVALIVDLSCTTAEAFASHAQDALLNSAVLER